MSSKQFDITDHAIEQFIRRWEPSKSIESAKDEMEALLRTSRQVGRTNHGDVIVVSGYRPDVRFVIKDRNVCITTLPQGSSIDDALEEEREEALRYAERADSRIKEKEDDIKKEIDDLQLKILDTDEQRKRLAISKTDALNRITKLKNELIALRVKEG